MYLVHTHTQKKTVTALTPISQRFAHHWSVAHHHRVGQRAEQSRSCRSHDGPRCTPHVSPLPHRREFLFLISSY